MNLFQVITLPIVLILFIRSLIVIIRGSQPRGMAVIGALVWLVAGIAILRPELTIQVAGMLGIGRGADLLLYLLVISYLISMFYIYNRFRKMDEHFTEIVRELAIRSVVTTDKSGNIKDMSGDTPGNR